MESHSERPQNPARSETCAQTRMVALPRSASGQGQQNGACDRAAQGAVCHNDGRDPGNDPPRLRGRARALAHRANLRLARTIRYFGSDALVAQGDAPARHCRSERPRKMAVGYDSAGYPTLRRPGSDLNAFFRLARIRRLNRLVPPLSHTDAQSAHLHRECA